jgi:hypothetical protein
MQKRLEDAFPAVPPEYAMSQPKWLEAGGLHKHAAHGDIVTADMPDLHGCACHIPYCKISWHTFRLQCNNLLTLRTYRCLQVGTVGTERWLKRGSQHGFEQTRGHRPSVGMQTAAHGGSLQFMCVTTRISSPIVLCSWNFGVGRQYASRHWQQCTVHGAYSQI